MVHRENGESGLVADQGLPLGLALERAQVSDSVTVMGAPSPMTSSRQNPIGITV